MAHTPHLYQVRDTYYFRVRIPKDLKYWFRRDDIKRTLRTKSPSSAKRLINLWAVKTDKLFTTIRTGLLTEAQTYSLIEGYAKNSLKRIDANSQPSPSPELPPRRLRLSQLIKLYVDENVAQESWSPKTRQEIQSLLEMFHELIGDPNVMTISRELIVDCLNKMKKLPARRHQLEKYRDKTLAELLTLDAVPNPLSTLTIKKRMTLLSSLFKWAVRHDHMIKNHAEGLAPCDKRTASQQRKTYSAADLHKLIHFLDAKYKPESANRADRWFIPFIALYSGMRLEEICQLHRNDVKKIDGIWVFDVNDDGDKKLKNRNSRRIVPVHPQLIEFGFVKYCLNVDHERLWPHLKKGANGYSHGYGRWFQKINRRHISTDPGKVFHSTRHNFTDGLKQTGVSEQQIAELVGHSRGSITMERYGKRYQPAVLLEVIKKLDYPFNLI